jgi:cytokinin dehydrogenase
MSRDWLAADLEALASLGVSLSLEATAKRGASADFGGIVHGQAVAVLAPRSAEELARAVAFAAERELSFTARGTGRSSGGQSIPSHGVSIDMSRLDRVLGIDPAARTLTCEAGARWRTLLAATQPHGLLPEVMPLNLDLTLGGTVSVGGFGSNSHLYGFSAASVVALEAVTGRGERLQASGADPLLQAVLGGVGRAGLITSLTLRLRRAPPRLRTFFLLYDDVNPWLSDMRAHRARFQHLDGFCSASVQGMRSTPRGRRPFAKWFYGLQATLEYTDDAPDADVALAGMRPTYVVHAEDSDQLAFASRADARFELMSQLGAFAHPHPWLECLLPVAALPQLLPRVLEALPLALGDGHRLALLATSPQPPLIAQPSGGENAMFAVLPMSVPPPLLPGVLEALRAVNQLLLQAGGKRYLAGYLELDGAGWQRHFGEAHASFVALKQRFDPKGVFGSVLTSTAETVPATDAS